MSVHPSSVVDPSARVHREASIGPFCVVGPDVEIGEGCRLLSHVVVHKLTALGAGNVLFPGASIGGDPQDLKYKGEPTRLTVGARNVIREGVTMSRGTPGGGGITTVGDDNLFMAQAHVGHDCHVGSRIIFANAATLAGHVEVADRANVGAYSGIHQFCRVAREAFIGGYSVVVQDALPWVTTVGNRASSHGINLIGMKRAGYPKETIEAVKRCYMTLFRSKLLLEEAMARVEKEQGEIPEVAYFLEFVRTSKRGVTR
ncbi:MAG TPA: acyl-ACP--UDP-N-acetylglucosamine O-acyltransferase [Candidatus Polarisedimenticolaceae bacterium]|nr:acyl-ACP--UDP-N-acetylglucosamine O-acyltransferase [Candidatus Polarisedimenticolaceae bacterium]